MQYNRGIDAGKRFLIRLDEFKTYKIGMPVIISLAFVAKEDGSQEHMLAESEFIIEELEKYGMKDIPLLGGMFHGPGNKFDCHNDLIRGFLEIVVQERHRILEIFKMFKVAVNCKYGKQFCDAIGIPVKHEFVHYWKLNCLEPEVKKEMFETMCTFLEQGTTTETISGLMTTALSKWKKHYWSDPENVAKHKQFMIFYWQNDDQSNAHREKLSDAASNKSAEHLLSVSESCYFRNFASRIENGRYTLVDMFPEEDVLCTNDQCRRPLTSSVTKDRKVQCCWCKKVTLIDFTTVPPTLTRSARDDSATWFTDEHRHAVSEAAKNRTFEERSVSMKQMYAAKAESSGTFFLYEKYGSSMLCTECGKPLNTRRIAEGDTSAECHHCNKVSHVDWTTNPPTLTRKPRVLHDYDCDLGHCKCGKKFRPVNVGDASVRCDACGTFPLQWDDTTPTILEKPMQQTIHDIYPEKQFQCPANGCNVTDFKGQSLKDNDLFYCKKKPHGCQRPLKLIRGNEPYLILVDKNGNETRQRPVDTNKMDLTSMYPDVSCPWCNGKKFRKVLHGSKDVRCSSRGCELVSLIDWETMTLTKKMKRRKLS